MKQGVFIFASLIVYLSHSSCKQREISEIKNSEKLSPSQISLKTYIDKFSKKPPDFHEFKDELVSYFQSIERYKNESKYDYKEIVGFLNDSHKVREIQKKIALINGSFYQINKFDLLGGDTNEVYPATLPSPYQSRSGLSLPAASTTEMENARVFHAKSHGCLSGEFVFNKGRNPELKKGFFEGDKNIPLAVRFSNGVGTYEHDARPDVRGLAIKFWDADQRGSEFKTWDLSLTNSPVPFGRNQQEFIEFLEASYDPGPLGTARLFTSLKSLVLDIDRDLTLNWWEMRGDLDLRIKNREEIKFKLMAQFDPTKNFTDFENGLYIWPEESSPFKEIGTVILNKKVRDSICEKLVFHPGRIHEAHRPLGNFGRGRMMTYMASAIGRGATMSDPEWATIMFNSYIP